MYYATCYCYYSTSPVRPDFFTNAVSGYWQGTALPSVVAIRFKPYLVDATHVFQGLSILFNIVAFRQHMVATVPNRTIGAGIHKSQIGFIVTCTRCGRDGAHSLWPYNIRLTGMLVRCRRGACILDSHITARPCSFLWSLCVESHSIGPWACHLGSSLMSALQAT